MKVPNWKKCWTPLQKQLAREARIKREEKRKQFEGTIYDKSRRINKPVQSQAVEFPDAMKALADAIIKERA